MGLPYNKAKQCVVILILSLKSCFSFIACPEPWRPIQYHGHARCDSICGKHFAIVESHRREKLLCYNRAVKAVPLPAKKQMRRGYEKVVCECVIEKYVSKTNRDYESCIPPRIIPNTSADSLNCFLECGKLHYLLYRPNNYDTLIRDCGNIMSDDANVHPVTLNGRVVHIDRKDKSGLKPACQCGLDHMPAENYSIPFSSREKIKINSLEYKMEKTTENIQNERKIPVDMKETEKISYISEEDFVLCQKPWRSTSLTFGRSLNMTAEEICDRNCAGYKAIHLPNGGIFCYHRVERAVPLYSIQEDKTLCECGAKYRNKTRTSWRNYEKCDPPKTYPNITDRKECVKKCGELNLLLYRPSKYNTVIRDCGDLLTQHNIGSIQSQRLHGKVIRVKRSDLRSSRRACVCGIRKDELLSKNTIDSSEEMRIFKNYPKKKRCIRTYSKKLSE